MKKNHLIKIGLIALLLVVLTACVRSLEPSVTQEALPTAPGGVAVVEEGAPTSDVMQQLEMFATQTVMASMGITTTLPGGAPVGTVVPGVDQQPPAGEQTPVAGGEQPAAGQQTPVAGGEQPATGQQTPVAGGEQPAATQPPAQAVEQQPAVPAPQVAVPTIPVPKEYTLHTGEHVYCIARRFDVNPSELLSINGLGNASVVFAGMALKIPQTNNTFPGQRALIKHPTNHTISSGETLYSIACQYGDVTPEAIAAVNSLTSPFKLQAGQQLYIP